MSERFTESEDEGLSLTLRVEGELERRRTEFQALVVFESRAVGRVLALDGVVQVTEADEHIYHEMIAHVPLLAHACARDVLIIGGGDGGTLREVLRHPVERATLVEIDREVVEVCRRHLPSVSAGAFDDPRVELVIADGVRFVAESDRGYDVIIVDSTDPIPRGPGGVLFSTEFYADCRRRLRPGGVVITQNGTPFLYPQSLEGARARLAASFADVAFYIAAVPTFVGGYMAFGWAADDPALRAVAVETLAERLAAAGFEPRFYTPELHRAAFVLPRDFGSVRR